MSAARCSRATCISIAGETPQDQVSWKLACSHLEHLLQNIGRVRSYVCVWFYVCFHLQKTLDALQCSTTSWVLSRLFLGEQSPPLSGDSPSRYRVPTKETIKCTIRCENLRAGRPRTFTFIFCPVSVARPVSSLFSSSCNQAESSKRRGHLKSCTSNLWHLCCTGSQGWAGQTSRAGSVSLKFHIVP